MQVTIVTGGGRGIGAACVRRLAAAGHAVAVNYRSDEAAAAAVVQAVLDAGGRAVAIQADVTDGADLEQLFRTTHDELGPVTGLINNAGATAHIADLADTPVETVRSVIDLNLTAAVLCARQAAIVMSTRRGGGGGSIVNISSGAATLGSPHEYVHYAAAKAGIDTLTVGLAKELAGDGIRVNAVAPGLINTTIHADAGDAGRLDRAKDRVPMARAGEVDEVAPAVAWLLSAEATYITGAVIRVAGGL
ncbi:MAG: SDR family oxidoreductase [Frankiaceae bacterium]|nr:SDR family oxidoreductase [Frankiaceae bacterium]MBV9871580.1 SDR family oxidoreductase [Frankiaceae bacterium]